MRFRNRLAHRLAEALPKDFVDLLERSRLDTDRGEVKNLSHAVEWTKAEAHRFPRDWSRRGVLRLGLLIPTAAGLFWPRPSYGVGFVGSYLIPKVITGPTYAVPNSTGGNDRTLLQTAFDGVAATGGTLVFPSGQTYLTGTAGTSPRVGIIGTSGSRKTNIRIIGNGSTIKAANGASTAGAGNQGVYFEFCSDLLIENLIADGNVSGGGGRSLAENPSHTFAFQSCDRVNLIDCQALNAPASDCFNFRCANGINTNPANHNHDVLLYRCIGRNGHRLGLGVIQVHNGQVIGGEYTDQQGATTTAPGAGMDVEPEPGATPGCEDILVRGVYFARNDGPGANNARNKNSPPIVEVERVTYEGCRVETQGSSPRTDSSACLGIRVACNNVLIQYNTFENLNFVAPSANGVIRSIGVDTINLTIDDNSINNCNCNGALIQMNGTGTRSCTNNRKFNSPPTITSGSGTFTNNTTSATRTDGGANSGQPVPPWVSFMGQECVP